MQLIPLPSETIGLTGFTHKVILDYTDVAAIGASASGLKQIFPEGSGTFAAGLMVTKCAMQLITAFDFSDAGITSLTLAVGDDGDVDRYLDETEVAVDGTEIFFAPSSPAVVTTYPHAYNAANAIDVTFVAANGGTPLLSECTSGKVEIYLGLVDLARLDAVL